MKLSKTSIKKLIAEFGDDVIILPKTDSVSRALVQACNSMQFFRHNNALWTVNMSGINGFNGTTTKDQILNLAPQIASSFCINHEGEMESTMFRRKDDDSVVNSDRTEEDMPRDGSQASQDHGLDSRRIVSDGQWNGMTDNIMNYESAISTLIALRDEGIVSNQPAETERNDKGEEVLGTVDRVLEYEAKRIAKRAKEDQEKNTAQAVQLNSAQSKMAEIYASV